MTARRILLIDDHAMVREGLRLLLTSKPQLQCEVHEAGSLQQGLEVLERVGDMDWVLLDLGLPDVQGIDAVRALRARHPRVPIVVVTGSEERSLVLECINHGAMGFIGKSSSGAALVEALLQLFSGGVHLPPTVFAADTGLSGAARRGAPVASREQLARLCLTPRQVDVIELLVQGMTNKMIATQLGLAEPTVKSHVAAGLRALNVRNRTQAVIALARLSYG